MIHYPAFSFPFPEDQRPGPDPMTPDQTIFAFRKGANAAILPGADIMSAFLESPKTAGTMELHRDDLARYAHFLKAVEAFEQSRKQGGHSSDFHDRLFYGVLLDSRFFKRELQTAIEQFKYYWHALARIDLKKPAAFIKSAEEEISRLRPGRKDDAIKIDRLQGMIDERKKQLDAQKAGWPALRAELGNIAAYIRDNLSAIRKRTEASIATLVELQVGKKAEQQLIEDIKTHFKDQIRDYLQHGPVTKEYLDSTKETVAQLSKQVSLQVNEDIYALTGLYEAIHDHAVRFAARLDPLVKQIGTSGADLERDKELFLRLESELLGVVSDFHFEIKPPHNVADVKEQETILQEKRREMLNRLFEILRSR
jgi:hypothetical protein